MVRKQARKNLHPAAKKLALQRTGLKRLSPTKTGRREMHALLEKHTGYKIPKLSDMVGNPSRYRVKARATQYQVITPGEKGHYEYNRRWGFETWVPAKPAVKKAIGEKLVIKKNSKKSGGGKSGGGSDRGTSHKTGSMQARKQRSKAAKKGMRLGREKKKKKKKK